MQFHEVMDDILSNSPRGSRSLASGDSRITNTILPEDQE